MSAEEIGIIILLALVVIGPQRLPEYAEQLGKLVRNARKMATGATATIREELGDDIADFDLSKFDPRQYDPRRIVREALMEDIVPATRPAKPKTKPVSAGGPAAVAASAAVAATTTVTSVEDAPVDDAPAPDAAPKDVGAKDAAKASTDSGEESALASAVVGAPFDDEAT